MKAINLVYDFDGTLTTSVAPQYKIIESCGYDSHQFNEYAKSNKEKYGFYDGWYKTYIELVTNKYSKITDELVCYGSKDIDYNPGVINFLSNFKLDNTIIKHYVVTSGIKVYIDNTLIAPYIDKTYGTTFKYDNKDIIGIDEIASSEKKIEHIKNINKINNRDELDCTNLIYIGDGLTDYNAFEFVKNHNGTSILVYNNNSYDNKLDSVINASFKADYSLDSLLVEYIKKTFN